MATRLNKQELMEALKKSGFEVPASTTVARMRELYGSLKEANSSGDLQNMDEFADAENDVAGNSADFVNQDEESSGARCDARDEENAEVNIAAVSSPEEATIERDITLLRKKRELLLLQKSVQEL